MTWAPLLWLLPLSLLISEAVTTASNSTFRQDSYFSAPQTLEDGIFGSKTCPRSCEEAGPNYEDWSHYSSLQDLAVCPEPLLLSFNLYGKPITSIRACSLGDGSIGANIPVQADPVSQPAVDDTHLGSSSPQRFRRQSSSNDTLGAQNSTAAAGGARCGTDQPRQFRAKSRLLSWDVGVSDVNSPAAEVNANAKSDVVQAMGQLADHVRSQKAQIATCKKLILFTYLRGMLVGFYSGSLVDHGKTSESLLASMATEMDQDPPSTAHKALEVCSADKSSASTVGVVVSPVGVLSTVQDAVKGWNEGSCVEAGSKSSSSLQEADVWSFDLAMLDPPALNINSRASRLQKRDDCRSIRVEQNDDCEKLAARCGIGGKAFENFNKDTSNLCSGLRAGQPVCCSSGSLPDVKPKPNPDGSCVVYAAQAQDGCDTVAAKHGLTKEDLEDLNKETWGWNGCNTEAGLILGQRICVSSGDPPMPLTFPDAVCGPTKVGSKRPTDGTKLQDINPCPLKVCCNVWGNCGTSSEFCTISETATGNPGTSNPNENGCQSSCGTKIVNDDVKPAQYRKIGYFEGWNFNRPCLHLNVLEVDKSYTHVHFAFGEISADMQVVIPDNQKKQWDIFLAATDYPKKILAFGGWAFSNEGPGAGRLREAVSPGNRDAFSDRVVKFAVDNKLDGLDFDWEYPGATDIKGSPPGNKDDGENYYQFLKLVRAKLPSSKSLSIAAPSSYWYLKAFPIEDMAKELDYIVYMTYDFHGQWDVGNSWAMSGCAAGNCLRSHVNGTITHGALVMITKAGVPTHKIVVGVTSYGRSFKMADPTCRDPWCTFLGGQNDSPAKKGRCTDTAGYISNFEIDEIKAKGGAIKQWWDGLTDTDILVYDQVEWVAYMTDETKKRRAAQYESWNMGGTSDWAIDLQKGGTLGEEDYPDSKYKPDPNWDKPLEACSYSPTTMDEIANLDFRNEIPPHCAAKYLVSVMHAMLKKVKARFGEILGDGYDKYFTFYSEHVAFESGEALFKLMMSRGGEWFDCEVYSKYYCCSGKHPDNCVSGGDCIPTSQHNAKDWSWRKNKMPCPPDFSRRGFNKDRYEMESIFWSFKDGDTSKNASLNEIYAATGIPPNLVDFPEHSPHYKQKLASELCYGSRPGDGSSNPILPYEKLGLGCQAEHWWHNGPSRSKDFSAKSVYNPKKDIEKVLNDLDVFPVLAEYELAAMAGELGDDVSESDLVEALVVPIFMMSSGLEQMEEVVKMGKDLEKANKIAFITNLISSVLLVAGGFGGVIAGSASTGLSILGRSLVLVAETGNLYLGLYFAVSDPKTIPLMIFGLVMSAANMRSATNLAKAATAKRQLSATQIAEISPHAGRMAGIAATASKTRVKLDVCRWG